METTASIIAVAQLCEKVIQYIKTVHGAKHEKQRLRSQVRNCSNLLLQLQDDVEDSDEAEEWAKTLELLSAPLARLQEALSLAAVALSARDSISEKLGWPFKEKDVEKLIEAIKGEMAIVSLALDRNATRLLLTINARSRNNEQRLIELKDSLEVRIDAAHRELKEIGHKIQLVQTNQDDVRKDLDDRQASEEAAKARQLILSWIPSTSHDSQQRDAISRRQPGTGVWLLRSEQYQDWLSTEGGTLFCPGIPGAGKTILASIINADLWERYHDNAEIGLAYLFCNFKRRDEQTLDGLLFQLLRQLVEQQPILPKQAQELYEQQQRTTSNRTIAIAEILQVVAAEYKRIFIVLDALDECSTADDCRTELLSHIAKLRRSTTATEPITATEPTAALESAEGEPQSLVNLLVTSRIIPDITERYKDHPRLNIEAHDADVRSYLVKSMPRLPGFVQKSTELQEEIIAKIIGSVRGMFLLAKLHLDTMIGKRSVKAIRTGLAKLATGSEAYNSAYEDAMERIKGQVPDQAELATQTLALITCVRRPLSTSELQQALGVEIDEPDLDPENFPEIGDVVSACAGLVTISEGSEIIRLVHYTTQEYLERTQERWFPDAQVMITRICTTYLAFEIFGKLGGVQNQTASPSAATSAPVNSIRHRKPLPKFHEPESKYTFYEYAANEWGHHAHLAPAAYCQIMNFLERPANMLAAHATTLPWYRKLVSVDPVHIAAEFGLEAPLVELLKRKAYPDPIAVYQDRRAWQHERESITPLLLAVKHDHEHLARILLEYGANASYVNEHRNSAVTYASANKNLGLVEVLRKHGADLEYPTELHKAAESGDLQRTEELIGTGYSCINALNSRRETSLLVAARSGHYDVANYLIQAGADIEVSDYHGHTPLLAATRSNHSKIVELLVTACADVNANTNEDTTNPSQLYSETTHEACIRQTLSEQTQSDKTYRSGATALMLAANVDNPATATLLLRSGAKGWAKDSHGRTALQYAILSGSLSVAKFILLLCPRKLSKNVFNEYLSMASKSAHPHIVELLLSSTTQTQSNASVKTSGIASALIAAVQASSKLDRRDCNYAHMVARYKAVAELLLRAGNEYEYDAFQDAENHILETLLHAGVGVNFRYKDGYTLFIWACLHRDISLVERYLQLGGNPNGINKQGRRPLYELCHAREPEEEKIKALLYYGADVNRPDQYGRTPLFAVRLSAAGALDLVKLLIKAGANVNHRSNKGRTPLFLAAKHHAVEVVELYLRHGASAIARDRAGLTPLSLAAKAPIPTEPYLSERYAATVQLLNSHVRSVSISGPRRSLKPPRSLVRSTSTSKLRVIDPGQPICATRDGLGVIRSPRQAYCESQKSTIRRWEISAERRMSMTRLREQSNAIKLS